MPTRVDELTTQATPIENLVIDSKASWNIVSDWIIGNEPGRSITEETGGFMSLMGHERGQDQACLKAPDVRYECVACDKTSFRYLRSNTVLESDNAFGGSS